MEPQAMANVLIDLNPSHAGAKRVAIASKCKPLPQRADSRKKALYSVPPLRNAPGKWEQQAITQVIASRSYSSPDR